MTIVEVAAVIELLVVTYREDRETERVVTNEADLIEVCGDVETSH